MSPMDDAGDLHEALALQRAAFEAAPLPALAQRREELLVLARMLGDHREA